MRWVSFGAQGAAAAAELCADGLVPVRVLVDDVAACVIAGLGERRNRVAQ